MAEFKNTKKVCAFRPRFKILKLNPVAFLTMNNVVSGAVFFILL